MKVDIPQTVFNWFRELGELNQQLFDWMLEALKNAPVAEDFASASRQLRDNVHDLPPGAGDRCLAALIMGGSIANTLRLDGSAFARIVAERFTAIQGSPSISPTSLLAADRLGALLAHSQSINLVAK